MVMDVSEVELTGEAADSQAEAAPAQDELLPEGETSKAEVQGEEEAAAAGEEKMEEEPGMERGEEQGNQEEEEGFEVGEEDEEGYVVHDEIGEEALPQVQVEGDPAAQTAEVEGEEENNE